jgi:DtxR family transcriptional regulator, Mn-dependent transcriptional regulator
MSESEEMYLVSIAILQEAAPHKPVAVPDLATQLGVLPVSVNQMVRRMEENELVAYLPYKGVDLTPHGRAQALQILRHRRLWEVFLVEHLNCSPEEATQLACRMEHTIPCHIAERLAAFLGNPLTTSEGKPIPGRECGSETITAIPITRLPLNGCGRLVQVTAEPALQSFLNDQGLSYGHSVMVIAIGANGSLLLQTENQKMFSIAENVAAALWVEPNSSQSQE